MLSAHHFTLLPVSAQPLHAPSVRRSSCRSLSPSIHRSPTGPAGAEWMEDVRRVDETRGKEATRKGTEERWSRPDGNRRGKRTTEPGSSERLRDASDLRTFLCLPCFPLYVHHPISFSPSGTRGERGESRKERDSALTTSPVTSALSVQPFLIHFGPFLVPSFLSHSFTSRSRM